jgi:tetratricopeptide (TPR) repeat protein
MEGAMVMNAKNIIAVLALLLTFSLTSQAESFDFVPASSGPEKELKTLMERGNFAQALMTWNTSATSFGNTADGKATWAYLVLKNGMPMAGIETLFGQTQPAQLSPKLLSLWKTELKNSILVQKGWIRTQGQWKAFSLQSTPVKIRNKADIQRAFSAATVAAKDNANESARILWKIATLAPQINETDSALRAIKLMLESGQGHIGRDMLYMTQGRILYQKNELDAALSAYQQIPKASNLWMEAVEERAWTYLRKDNYDKAMGTMVTALSPSLSLLGGPESYFLSNLLSLKVCDYKRLFQTSELFKKRHRARLEAEQALAKTGTNDYLNNAMSRFDTGGVNQESAGALVEFLPRQIYRDSAFLRAMGLRRQMLVEMQTVAKFSDQGGALGANGELQARINSNQNKVDSLRQIAVRRIRDLAKIDLQEYKVNLNKMHIIEAEVIERMHLDDNLKGQRSKLSKNDTPKDALVFPYDSQDEWADEWDNYEARVKDCPTLKGASL